MNNELNAARQETVAMQRLIEQRNRTLADLAALRSAHQRLEQECRELVTELHKTRLHMNVCRSAQ